MSYYKRFLPWLPCILLSAVALGRAAGRAENMVGGAPPADVPSLVDALRGRGVGLESVSIGARDDGHRTAFLCDGLHRPDEVRRLCRNRARAAEWSGVVLAWRDDGTDSLLPSNLSEWGDSGLLVNPWVFFGDPALVARIRAALTHGAG